MRSILKLASLTILVLLAAAVCAQTGDAAWTGSWAGTWDDGGGNSGSLKMKLEKADGKWKAEAGFDIGGQDVPCKVKSIKIEDDAIEIAYDWDFQGTAVTSTLTGKRKDRAMEGTYKSGPAGQTMSTGTWKLSAK